VIAINEWMIRRRSRRDTMGASSTQTVRDRKGRRSENIQIVHRVEFTKCQALLANTSVLYPYFLKVQISRYRELLLKNSQKEIEQIEAVLADPQFKHSRPSQFLPNSKIQFDGEKK
jgi:hypothetical protein